jgi:hypothetical protein
VYWNDPSGATPGKMSWEDFWENALEFLSDAGGGNGEDGGMWWRSDGSYGTYSSDQAFNAGADYADHFNMWGQYGVAESRSEAYVEFIKIQHLQDVTNKFYAQLARTELFYTQWKEKFDKEKFTVPGNKRYEMLMFFAQTIGTGKMFDIKQPGKGFNHQEIGYAALFENEELDWDDFGNINFGLAARIFGFSLEFVKDAAGINQVFGDGNGSPDWGNWRDFFDERMDSQMIERGYNMKLPWD